VNANFSIPEPVTAAILLSTLPSNPKDLESWDYFIKGVKIDQTTTTLLSIINQILKEKCCQSPATDTSQPESALAAREQAACVSSMKFCENCKRNGHEMASCWAPGGGKEGQGPRRKQKKEKDKEKANVADAGGDESSNIVFEKCLVACEVTFSAYSSCKIDPIQFSSTPLAAVDSMYSAHTMSSTAPIIDSGATSHIFADWMIFLNSTSHHQEKSMVLEMDSH